MVPPSPLASPGRPSHVTAPIASIPAASSALPRRLIRRADYREMPWKNGGGVTLDIWTWPEDARQDDADIGISIAPIVAPGPFSVFPGIERHITLIEGDGITLVFGTDERRLAPLAPFVFDGGDAPVSRLEGGPVRVLNVKVRAGLWRAEVRAVAGTGGAMFDLEAGQCFALHALKSRWRVSDAGDDRLVEAGDTFVTGGAGRLVINAPDAAAEALAVVFTPSRPVARFEDGDAE
ncbi:HutD/Ves family protein [Ancylobacter terrae]|uniref:HutD/Ves family protein n=1 Tax=Ancylobacter sp. sgz301288 TaxID=3342077 RepID=UPI00385C5A58